MPTFNVPPNYASFGGYFQAGKATPVERGIKIHISANIKSAQRICDVLLGYLTDMGVLHKVRMQTDDVELVKYVNQMRKFITVYPDSAEQLKGLMWELDSLLCEFMKTGGNPECYPIVGDLKYGRSGYVFLRFGAFTEHKADDDRQNVSDKVTSFLRNGIDPFALTVGRHAADAGAGVLASERDTWPAVEGYGKQNQLSPPK